MKKPLGILLALCFCLTACAPAAAPETETAVPDNTATGEAAPGSAGALRGSSTLGDTGEARYTLATSVQEFTPGTTYDLQVLRLDYATARPPGGRRLQCGAAERHLRV